MTYPESECSCRRADEEGEINDGGVIVLDKHPTVASAAAVAYAVLAIPLHQASAAAEIASAVMDIPS